MSRALVCTPADVAVVPSVIMLVCRTLSKGYVDLYQAAVTC